MNDEHFDDDPELRALLRSADPADSLPPADPEGLAGLLHQIQEGTMTDIETPTQNPTGPTAGRTRGPLTWVAAAAAAAIVGGVGYAAIASQGDDDSNVAAQGDPSVAPVDMTLTQPADSAGKCAVPSPEILTQFDVAFEGTVTSVEGDVATLSPVEMFAGEPAETIEITSSLPGNATLTGLVDFEVGKTYLVAASAGEVGVCGFSGEATASLQQLYDDTFR